MSTLHRLTHPASCSGFVATMSRPVRRTAAQMSEAVGSVYRAVCRGTTPVEALAPAGDRPLAVGSGTDGGDAHAESHARQKTAINFAPGRSRGLLSHSTGQG